MRSLVVAALLALWLSPASAGPLVVAVAANFSDTLEPVIARFSREQDIPVQTVVGSTGLLFAQIQRGAPYHVFLAADLARPRALIESGNAPADTLTVYAQGQLAFWTPGVAANIQDISAGDYRRIALANPRLAPYGVAAEATLKVLGRLQDGDSDGDGGLIFGENVGAAYTVVATGNASAGLVALSQLIARDVPTDEYAVIPADMHPPILQAGVITQAGSTHADASAFLQFLVSPWARQQIDDAGYLPAEAVDGA